MKIDPTGIKWFHSIYIHVQVFTDQNRLADDGHGLTGRGGGEVDGEVGQTQDAHQGLQSLLGDKLSAVVVRRVVGEDGLHKLHLKHKDKNYILETNKKYHFLVCKLFHVTLVSKKFTYILQH